MCAVSSYRFGLYAAPGQPPGQPALAVSRQSGLAVPCVQLIKTVVDVPPHLYNPDAPNSPWSLKTIGF